MAQMFCLTARSRKGQNRLAGLRHHHPNWDGRWWARAQDIYTDQVFLHPHIPEPFCLNHARWVQCYDDPNFILEEVQ